MINQQRKFEGGWPEAEKALEELHRENPDWHPTGKLLKYHYIYSFPNLLMAFMALMDKKGRWPLFEEVTNYGVDIDTSGRKAVQYAVYHAKERIPELEEQLLKRLKGVVALPPPITAARINFVWNVGQYAKWLMPERRWPEAEEIILSAEDSALPFEYASHLPFRVDRWPEFEEYLLKRGNVSEIVKYIQRMNSPQNPWREGINYVLEHGDGIDKYRVEGYIKGNQS